MSAAEIWIVDLALSTPQLSRCAAVLDSAEIDRAARFVRQADRARYQASHAALRFILGNALNIAPGDLSLGAGAAGKPELAGQAREAVDFNLSHSGSRALVGVTHGAAIGVDVEAIRPISDALRIARSHFAPDEAAALAALPANQIETAFFGLWTRKEAVVKALGTGLALPLDRFSVSVPPAPPRLVRVMQNGPWTLAAIDAGPDYAATIAVRSADATVSVRHLANGWPSRLR